MPRMSTTEALFCRSVLWRFLARRIVSWSTQGWSITGGVLEIGGGSGAMAEAIIKSHGQVNLTTTDVDLAMVQAAQRSLAGLPIETRQADATALPFADESFDTVLSFLMLHHVVEWEQAVAEVARVLRPGGLFVGYDLLSSRVANWLHRVDGSPHRLFEAAAFESALQQVGLEPLRLRSTRGGLVLRFVVQKPSIADHNPGNSGYST
ncbi:class I SAM-dependent methyltransferase [Corynebacterium hylobatis]|uniref:Class I SAM-dependent methyltransferase n=2 Tax=Corynebacterium hylobatis TaxID=1859290 RepID=A0A430HV63_9CORY|nr:class I SAM-dependent methyltransferase [Corynebacterium hylobatis]